MSGESRVRAWLEDVKQLDARWRNLDEERNFTKRYFDHVNQIIKAKETRDVDIESTRLSTRSLPPISNEVIFFLSIIETLKKFGYNTVIDVCFLV